MMQSLRLKMSMLQPLPFKVGILQPLRLKMGMLQPLRLKMVCCNFARPKKFYATLTTKKTFLRFWATQKQYVAILHDQSDLRDFGSHFRVKICNLARPKIGLFRPSRYILTDATQAVDVSTMFDRGRICRSSSIEQKHFERVRPMKNLSHAKP